MGAVGQHLNLLTPVEPGLARLFEDAEQVRFAGRGAGEVVVDPGREQGTRTNQTRNARPTSETKVQPPTTARQPR